MAKKPVVLNIEKCARCGEDHNGLELKKLTNPVEGGEFASYWAPCPINGQPILFRMKDEYEVPN